MQLKKQRLDLTQAHSNAQVVIILANQMPWSKWFEPILAQVGTLPVLLRAILGVQSMNPEHIVVVFNRLTGPQIRSELFKTQRVPAGLKWIEAAEGASLSSIIRVVTAASECDRILVVAGDRTYQPALHRMVSEWDGRRGVLELATGSQPVGLFALSHEAALELGADWKSNVVTVRDMHRWITQEAISDGPSFVDFRLVEQDSWQEISMPQDCILAEIVVDDTRHVGIKRLVVGQAGAEGVGHRDVAGTIGIE